MRPPLVLLMVALVLVMTSCTGALNAIPRDPLALSRSFAALSEASDAAIQRLAVTQQELNSVEPDSPAASESLQALCNDLPQAAHCTLRDAGQMVHQVFPPDQLSYAETVVHPWQSTLETEWASLSCTRVYRTPSGFDAIDVGLALPDGGTVAATLNLGAWLGAQITTATAGLPVEVWIMQPDGLILYDLNRAEIGRNLFADPLYQDYPELQVLGERIATDASGSGAYTFLRKDMREPVEKTASWNTFDFCGQPWRVVMAHSAQVREDGSALVTDSGLTAAQDALRTAAADPVLGDALATGDQAWGRTVFRSLYDAYPSIYAVQFVDAQGVNQYGYPPENSLTGYDYRALQSQTDEFFLEALQREHEESFDLPLLEGPEGHFFLTPVFRGAEFLGMIYLIQTQRE